MFVIDPAKLLPLFNLSADGVTKSTSFDLDVAQNGAGSFVVSVGAVTVANQGLPDYWVDLVIAGLTFPENDPDKSIILNMHAEALNTVCSWNPQYISSILELADPAAVVGIINIASTFNYDGQTNIFRITLRLATTGAYLTYYERELPVYEVDDAGNGITYIRFADSSPCAVQRITRVQSFAEDGGVRVSTTREVAIGDWANRTELDYYPINQPIPVAQS